jgi:hypothetical protein
MRAATSVTAPVAINRFVAIRSNDKQLTSANGRRRAYDQLSQFNAEKLSR